MSDGDSSSIGGEDVQCGSREEPMLALLSNLYSKLEIISISVNRPSSYLTLYFLLTILTTDY